MNPNQKITATDIVLLLLLMPLFVLFRDDIRLLLLTVAVVWFPLSAAVYLLRWYLRR